MKPISGRRACVALATMLCAAALPGAAQAAKPKPDLAAGGLTTTATSVSVGQPFTVTVTVRNSGRGTAKAARTRLYLSRDAKVDARDLTLATVASPKLKRKKAARKAVPVKIPTTLAPGTYRLIACVDATRRVRERSERNNCRVASARIKVTALPAPPPPPPTIAETVAGTDAPAPGDKPLPKPTVTPNPTPAPVTTANATVGACRPLLTVGAVADRTTVVEGEDVSYSATIRHDPDGPCLGVAGQPTVAGDIDVATTMPQGESVMDIAMWLEVTAGGTRTVLPQEADLSIGGTPGCPGSECSAALQDDVGNVAYPMGKVFEIEAGGTRTIPFRFFPTLGDEDFEAIADGDVELVIALTLRDRVSLRRVAVTFADARTLEGVELVSKLGGGAAVATALGDLAPGDQLDVADAGTYTTSAADPDTIESEFRARAENPATTSDPVVVSTMVTTDPAARPDLFPTASPNAITAGTSPDVLVTAALRGVVTGEPAVSIDGGAVLGTLRDDGTGGDMSAGDQVWSGVVTPSLATSGALRVDATLDGVEISGTVDIEVLPVGAPTTPAPASTAAALPGDGAPVIADRISITMADGAPYSAVAMAAQRVGGTVAGRTSPSIWQIAIAPVASRAALDAILEEISGAPDVIGAEAVPVFESTGVVPNDPFFTSQPYLQQIGADSAWIVNRGDKRSVIVAILDTGVDRDHPDLVSRLLPGTDFANGDNNPEDSCGHGTHVAGTAAAATANGAGIAGMNWNARILPVKVFPTATGANACKVGAQNLAAAIRWAVDQGASVINMSLAGPGGRSEDVAEALQYAWMADRVVVAAAGNANTSTRYYPAAYERTEEFSSWFGLVKRSYYTDVLAVGNVTGSDARNATSNYGDWVDVAAPGTALWSADLNGTYSQKTGTSMASPVVAGLASLMLADQHTVTSVIRHRLVTSGREINQSVGARVNAFEAVFNGSFESGLAGWQTTGTATTVDRLGPIVPLAGKRMLSLSTGPAGAEIISTARKTVTMRSDWLRDNRITVSLSYNYVTEEYPEYVGSQYNDDLRISLALPNGQELLLATETVNTTAWTPVSGIDFPGGDFTAGQSGWKTATATIAASALGGAGSFDIVVQDVGDAVYDSVALIDRVFVS